MLIGGIVSKASGGSFERGAVTAGVVFLYNDGMEDVPCAMGGNACNHMSKNVKDFYEGVKSIPVGLYRFGDYLGRISGLRDIQNPSVISGVTFDYQREAIEQTKYTYKLTKYILTNDYATDLAFDYAKTYIEEHPAKVLGRLLAFPIGLYGKAPITPMATYGDVIYGSNQIEDFVKGIVYGE